MYYVKSVHILKFALDLYSQIAYIFTHLSSASSPLIFWSRFSFQYVYFLWPNLPLKFFYYHLPFRRSTQYFTYIDLNIFVKNIKGLISIYLLANFQTDTAWSFRLTLGTLHLVLLDTRLAFSRCLNYRMRTKLFNNIEYENLVVDLTEIKNENSNKVGASFLHQ